MKRAAIVFAVISAFILVSAFVFWKKRQSKSIAPQPDPEPKPETYVSGDTVGMRIDRGTETALANALTSAASTAQWLACVPAIQLEKLARTQTSTGVTTLKSADVLDAMRKRKNATLARIQRLPVSPAFKSSLIQFANYVLDAASGAIQQYSDKNGFVSLAKVADALKGFRGGYCTGLTTNFGIGNSFLPATG